MTPQGALANLPSHSTGSAVFRRLPGEVRVDVPAGQKSFVRWLVSMGLEERAVRAEMARGAGALPWSVHQRFALAAQAWG